MDKEKPQFQSAWGDWRAFGPEKQAWKEEGHYYSPEELAQMEASFQDLELRPACLEKIYVE